MEDSGVFEYKKHPLTKSEFHIAKRKNGKIQEIIIKGTHIKNSSETIMMSKRNEILQVMDIVKEENRVKIIGKILKTSEFDNELIAFKILSKGKEKTFCLSELNKFVGHIYPFKKMYYVFFNKFLSN